MSLIGINRDEVTEYISEFDKDKKDPTIFEIGILDNRAKLTLLNGMIDSKGELDIKAFQNKSYEIVKAGLKKIRHLYNKKEQRFEILAEINDEALNRLSMVVITELAGKIIEMNFLTEQEGKN